MRAEFDTTGAGALFRPRMRVAVIGSGVSGASAAWALSHRHDVVLYEAAEQPGGHTATKTIDYDGTPVSVDTGFIVFNTITYPLLTKLLAHLDVATHASSMSFSLSLDDGKLEWCGDNLRSVFAQKRNLASPGFLWMLKEILRFNSQSLRDRAAGRLAGRTIGEYLSFGGYSARFRDDYLIPMAAAIWSTPRVDMLDFPAEPFVIFFETHRLLQLRTPIWRTVTGGSRNYLDKLLAPLGPGLRTGAPVVSVRRAPGSVFVRDAHGRADRFDRIVLAGHSDQTLALLDDASEDERSILSAIGYRPNRVVLHRDPSFMPKRRGAWAAWNYHRGSAQGDEANVSLTYWMNRLQGIDERFPLFVSLNPAREPATGTVFGEWTYEHPQFDAAAIAAQKRLPTIQGKRDTWFAGAWTGYGFHEDGLRSGLEAARALGAAAPWDEPMEALDAPMLIAAE